MPDDDDQDCDGHDFVVTEVLADSGGARMVHACARCGAVTYEPSSRD